MAKKKKRRERCAECGTPLNENPEGYTEDPEMPAACPGCGMALPCTALEAPEPALDERELPTSALTKRFSEVFGFVQLPFVWRDIQTDEETTSYDATDKWMKTCRKAKLEVRGGPVLNLGVQCGSWKLLLRGFSQQAATCRGLVVKQLAFVSRLSQVVRGC